DRGEDDQSTHDDGKPDRFSEQDKAEDHREGKSNEIDDDEERGIRKLHCTGEGELSHEATHALHGH
ncbi:hypothetical protein SB658_25580, partial [Bacillus sp. SIMBA_008]|uniref:hypothetical protein n=1 Tax=Bacillus sp. SIMBA_008 TaxID=3085757 RepID=UPI0039793E28